VKLAGAFASKGVEGTNSLRFSGRVGGRALGRGNYVLVARAVGREARASFRILA
jgi:hypothetical protein